MSTRWRQQKSYSELVKIHRAILDAKELVDAERAQDVRAARDEARIALGTCGLFTASFATGRDPHCQTLAEFQRMAQRMREGGYHRARLNAGGELEL